MTDALLKGNALRVLNEVCAKIGSKPNFELLHVEGEQHRLIFSYKATVDSMFTIGTGHSKQKARNAAAELLLHKMMVNPERKRVIEAKLEEMGATDNGLAFLDADKICGNPVGYLQELCASRRWPPPYYSLVGEDPPPNRLFTVVCCVMGVKEAGAGSSKKKAKRMAAQKMCSLLDSMYFQTDNSSIKQNDLKEDLNDLEERFIGLKENQVPTLSDLQSDVICQFYRKLKKNRSKKLSELQAVTFSGLNFNCVQFLQELAAEQHFEVTYVDTDERSFCGDYQCVVQLSSLPVAVCYGHGATSKEAQFSAAMCALEYLRILTKA